MQTTQNPIDSTHDCTNEASGSNSHEHVTGDRRSDCLLAEILLDVEPTSTTQSHASTSQCSRHTRAIHLTVEMLYELQERA